MSLEDDMVELRNRVVSLENKVDLLTRTTLNISPPSSSQGIWVMKQTLEAKKELAEVLLRDYSYQVADGIRWRDEEHRKRYRRLQLEIHELTEELAR